MKQILTYLYEHKTLTKDEAKTVLTNIAKGKYNDSQIASFISVYLMRSITVEELGGFRDALLDLCVPVDLSDYNTIDLCGTGGDEKDTFNISTLASFVVAGAGGKVAKHGNYGVSSTCGSSNVMEFLGYRFTGKPQQLRKEIETAGLCFLHAPLFNPAMKNVAPVRRQLGMKTFFNMLGPMVNPSFPKNQMVGVFGLEIARLYNYLYQQTDKNFVILHSLDGYDEISLTGEVKMLTNREEKIITPESLSLPKYRAEELSGGKSIEEAARIFMNVLEGKATDAQTDVVIANAAMGIKCLDLEKSVDECVTLARESINSGKALKALKTLLETNKTAD